MHDDLSLLENTSTQKTVSILGVPIDLGKDYEGTEDGPKQLRANGLNQMFQKTGIKITDLGDIAIPKVSRQAWGSKEAKFLKEVAAISEKVSETVKGEIEKGNIMLAIGGDHTLSLGSVAGASLALGGDLGLIYIDAHPDANTPESTLSGNIHGMITTSLSGFGPRELTEIGGPSVKIKKENILFIGLKDLDQFEIDWIRGNKIPHATIHDIAERGLSPVFEKIAALQKRVKHIWVSFDHDAVDAAHAPGHGMATPGGITYREIVALAKYIGKTCSVAGIDSVEYLPANDQENKTASLIAIVVAGLLGAEYGWYTSYMESEANKQALRQVDQVLVKE